MNAKEISLFLNPSIVNRHAFEIKLHAFTLLKDVESLLDKQAFRDLDNFHVKHGHRDGQSTPCRFLPRKVNLDNGIRQIAIGTFSSNYHQVTFVGVHPKPDSVHIWNLDNLLHLLVLRGKLQDLTFRTDDVDDRMQGQGHSVTCGMWETAVETATSSHRVKTLYTGRRHAAVSDAAEGEDCILDDRCRERFQRNLQVACREPSSRFGVVTFDLCRQLGAFLDGAASSQDVDDVADGNHCVTLPARDQRGLPVPLVLDRDELDEPVHAPRPPAQVELVPEATGREVHPGIVRDRRDRVPLLLVQIVAHRGLQRLVFDDVASDENDDLVYVLVRAESGLSGHDGLPLLFLQVIAQSFLDQLGESFVRGHQLVSEQRVVQVWPADLRQADELEEDVQIGLPCGQIVLDPSQNRIADDVLGKDLDAAFGDDQNHLLFLESQDFIQAADLVEMIEYHLPGFAYQRTKLVHLGQSPHPDGIAHVQGLVEIVHALHLQDPNLQVH